MNKEQYSFLKDCAAIYQKDLVSDIMPFWLKHGLDNNNGGLYTCLNRDGALMDTTKSVWFQGRFGFVAAYAYNNIEQNAEWLSASASCINFMEEHCSDSEGRMYFEVEGDGTPLRLRRYMFSECFAIIAMAEYAKASGDMSYAAKSLELFEKVIDTLATPEMLPSKYLPALKTRGHSIVMILINTALCVKCVADAPILDKVIDNNIEELKNYFMNHEYKALLECVGENGEFIDTGMGRVINPGHAIETAWFLMDVAISRDNDKKLIDLATTILDWSWEWGWDKEFGGITNLKDCKNLPPQDYAHDMKFWWPQCEAIIATLMAYKLTHDEKYLVMHRMIHEWTYKHFPDREYGEWYGYLHKNGSVSQPAKGNIFKGPFHIPRMMIKSHLICKDILDGE